MATLTFLGAAQQVTGSCYLVECCGRKLLLECGLRQGEDQRGRDEYQLPAQVQPHAIDAVVLSHAHLDHSGLLPLLVRQGYRNPVYATEATVDLLPIMYRDAASLLRSDYERRNRRRQRAGKEELEPPFDSSDVEHALALLHGIPYGQHRNLLPGIDLRFVDAGHILGSAIVEIWLHGEAQPRKLVFSGDLGNNCAPLMKDPAVLPEADVLLLESTYGDRNHRDLDKTLEEFNGVLEDASRSGGNILIPAFAVGRTQDMIYHLGRLQREGRLPRHRVFIDSPMAIRVSEVYAKHQDLFNHDDPNFRAFMEGGWDNWLPGLTYTVLPEESMALNRITEGAIVVAGSGMCSGGRILHHLKHNLWRNKTQVVITGYQARGGLGRLLVDGATSVRIFGEDIAVKARIHTLGGFSAHAGQDQLVSWATRHQGNRAKLFLVHGEIEAMLALQDRFRNEHRWEAQIPAPGDAISV
ncbi:MAG: MBL fold metallo-hydrolase [Gammaproteobacteria bacterium]|nr:MBL fold metallo-hydrolase [Gammaproteobacteria bacterium]